MSNLNIPSRPYRSEAPALPKGWIREEIPRSSGGGTKPKSNGQSSKTPYDFTKSLRNDANLVPPIRQTASIFKQPVTVHKQSAENKVKVDKTTTSEKPKQLYWEKRLSGLRPSYPNVTLQPFELPKNFKPVGPGVVEDIALASIATSLHINSGAIVGQNMSKFKQGADPALFINPEQPLISATEISNEDIEKQEQKVLETRRKLAEAIQALSL